MEKFAHMVLLADFYGPLLTDKQRKIWDLHFEQDLSLGEIGEVEQISRQAVHDLVKRTEKILLEYEEKLGLAGRFLQEREKLQDVLELIQKFEKVDFYNREQWQRCQAIKVKIEDIYQGIAGDIKENS